MPRIAPWPISTTYSLSSFISTSELAHLVSDWSLLLHTLIVRPHRCCRCLIALHPRCCHVHNHSYHQASITLDLWDVTDDPMAAPLPVDAAKLMMEERKEVQDWEKCKGQASGQIWLAVEDGQKVHVKDVKNDPAKMWLKLKEVHVQQKPGTRFNAYDALLGLCKLEGESLTSLMARAD
ncbi:hypothetical protein NEOLEDRAFT_1197429, partial [Neolentinus lepideus HHB14362 ss-1]